MYNKREFSQTNKIIGNQVPAFIKLFKMAPATLSEHVFADFNDAFERGLIFLDEQGKVCETIPGSAFQYAVDFYGVEPRKFNNTFYKSFSTVRDAAPSELLFDQLLHYFSTYGLESVGVKVPAYVPLQALDIPEASFDKGLKLTVIQLASTDTCVERLNEYLKTLTAPSREIVDFVKTILPLATINDDEIKSFEIQIIRHQLNGTVPTNPVSFLRYLVFMTTGETLIIKNRYLRERIKMAANSNGTKAFEILSKADMGGLASIFLRYKPIFLAFKTHKECAPIINHLRRLAVIHHKPLPNETLQNFFNLDNEKARQRIIKNASNRELVKLVNSIANKLMADDDTPAIYPIRNGRTYVKADAIKGTKNLAEAAKVLGYADNILTTLYGRLAESLSGKTFYLPDYIDYAVPTSEKQMIGNIPFGSQIINSPQDGVVLGIHWVDQGGRTDFDLHLNSATRHFGWNASYKDGDKTVYTGDMTSAPLPNGAAEAFWLSPQNEVFLADVSLYSGADASEFKLFMTSETLKGEDYDRWGARDRQNKNYIFDPNKALFPAIPLKMQPGARSQTLGMFVNGNFYFYGGSVNTGIVPTANYADFLKGLVLQLTSKLRIREVLKDIEGDDIKVITSLEGLTPDELKEVISLAPEDLTVDTLFNIIDGKI